MNRNLWNRSEGMAAVEYAILASLLAVAICVAWQWAAPLQAPFAAISHALAPIVTQHDAGR